MWFWGLVKGGPSHRSTLAILVMWSSSCEDSELLVALDWWWISLCVVSSVHTERRFYTCVYVWVCVYVFCILLYVWICCCLLALECASPPRHFLSMTYRCETGGNHCWILLNPPSLYRSTCHPEGTSFRHTTLITPQVPDPCQMDARCSQVRGSTPTGDEKRTRGDGTSRS